MTTYDINDKVFNLNQFIEGKGGTKHVRLDELNALRAGHEVGKMSAVGDASAMDIVDWLLKRAGVVGHDLFMQLHEAFAEAILRVAGDEPYLWVNPQAAHAARRVSGLLEPEHLESPDFSHVPNGYPKPTDEQAEETRRAQEEVTRREKDAQTQTGETPEEKAERERRAEQEKMIEDAEAALKAKQAGKPATPANVQPELENKPKGKGTSGTGTARGKGSSSKGDGPESDPDLKKILGDGDK